MNKKLLTAALLLSAQAQAQVVNDAAVTNDGGIANDFGISWTNTANGVYTGKSGAEFHHSGPSINTFVNNGTYAPGTGGMTDKFLGPNGSAGTQEIAGNAEPAFHFLWLANGSSSAFHITNSHGVRVNDFLVLDNGISTTVRSNAATGAIKLAAGAGIGGTPSDARHVDGYVTKTGNTTFSFPVGDGTQHRQLFLATPPSAATDAMSVAYFSGDPGTALDPTGGAHSRTAISTAGTAGLSQIVSVSSVGFWDWVPVTGISSVIFTVSIPDMNVAGGFATAAEMRVVGWNTSTNQWENLSGTATPTGYAAGSFIQGEMSDMSQYSAIGLGSVSSWPLRLELLHFSASLDASCRAQISWKTADEEGVEAFAVEYGTDGRSYCSVGEVSPKGVGDYAFAFDGVHEGSGFFRLKTLHADGSIEYSRAAQVRASCGGAGSIIAGPNPLTNELHISGLTGETTVHIFTMAGQLVHEETTTTSSLRIAAGDWAGGAYILCVSSEGREPIVQRLTKL